MFREAISKARHFTRPVLLARLSVAGNVTAGAGSFIVVNDEGWILTAAHIIDQIVEMSQQEATVTAHEAQQAAINSDTTLSHNEKRKALKKLGSLNGILTKKFFPWWGVDGVTLTNITAIRGLDLAVGKLEPFNPAWVATYPKFKDPGHGGVEPGVSLCRLGYPFYEVVPTYDAARNHFDLPVGGGLPQFPIEGILTRFIELDFDPPNIRPNVNFPLKHIETSSPGLKGQSGGPIFDTDGTIWAVQAVTDHYPLGFDPIVPNTNGRQKEHQFLNVGRGPHIESIVGLLQQVGVGFEFA